MNALKNSYDNSLFAKYYDFIVESMGRKNLTNQESLIRFCVEKFGAPILEMGCGTGVKLLPLAEAGHLVTGLDSSSAMLDIFEQKLSSASPDVREKVNLILGDMIDPPIQEQNFRLILFLGSQFLHLNSDEQRLACLKKTYELLDNDGVGCFVNSKLLDKPQHDWLEQLGAFNSEWRLLARRRWENGAYQDDMKLVSRFQEHQQHEFRWRLYPIDDSRMKELIGQAGLRCIPIPVEIIQSSPSHLLYLCQKKP